MIVYVTAFVPVASLQYAEGAIAPYLAGAGNVFAVPLVPVGEPDDAEPTHYGCCASTTETSGMYAALPSLKAAFPGADYAVVTLSEFDRETHWVEWLVVKGLKNRRAAA
jgi:hypothetical protein